MSNSGKNILKQIVKVVHELEPSAKVYLFGSRANGTNKGDSDWDILILLDKDTVSLEDEQRITYPLYDLEFETGEVISPMIYGEKEWNSKYKVTPLFKNILREGRLLLSEYYSEDYFVYRIERAKGTLEEVHVLVDNKFWNTAVNRMYYACFYAVSSLMAKNGIEASSHKGVRQMFGTHFVKTGIFDKRLAWHFSDLFDKRQKADYNDFYDYDERTVLQLIPGTEAFVEQIEQIINKEV